MCVYVCVHIKVESGFPLKQLDYLVLKAKVFCMHNEHGAQWDISPTVPRYETGMAVIQVSTDPHEEVTQQAGCTCLSESEILTAVHQLKKGRPPSMEKIPPEVLKLGRDESIEDLRSAVFRATNCVTTTNWYCSSKCFQ